MEVKDILGRPETKKKQISLLSLSLSLALTLTLTLTPIYLSFYLPINLTGPGARPGRLCSCGAGQAAAHLAAGAGRRVHQGAPLTGPPML